MSLSKKLKSQIWGATMGGDHALAVVGCRPRKAGIEWCKKNSIALWLVAGESIEELLPVAPHDKGYAARKDITRKYIEQIGEGVVGGLPCLAGQGVAQEVQRQVDAYRALHPKATWKEIHANVPSHYRTPANMYSALRSNKERLAFRARIKAARRA